jgi:hypothetical protein
MIASTFNLVRRTLSRLRYLANPIVTFPLNQNRGAVHDDMAISTHVTITAQVACGTSGIVKSPDRRTLN